MNEQVGRSIVGSAGVASPVARTELQDMSSLLAKIMDAKYHSYMHDAAMDGLRDAGMAVVDSIVELAADNKDDRQAKLDAITTLSLYNQDGCYTRAIARVGGSLELDASVAA